MTRQNRLHRHKGVTFVEILIAVLIFVIGIVSVMGGLTFSLSSILKSRDSLRVDAAVVNQAEKQSLLLETSPDVELDEGEADLGGGDLVHIEPGSTIGVSVERVNFQDSGNVQITALALPIKVTRVSLTKKSNVTGAVKGATRFYLLQRN